MFPSRFGLQSKIIIILAVAVVSVVGLSTYLAMVLTRQLVEEAIYRKYSWLFDRGFYRRESIPQ